MNNSSLTETLSRLGFTTAKADGLYRRKIIDRKTGDVVFTGNAGETWRWLRECGLIDRNDKRGD